LFEPNYNEPLESYGTGIELSICREIVHQHHGEITARNANGAAVIRVMLPTDPSDMQEDEQA
jgi:signal transduction histidine kinase